MSAPYGVAPALGDQILILNSEAVLTMTGMVLTMTGTVLTMAPESLLTMDRNRCSRWAGIRKGGVRLQVHDAP